MVIQDSVSMVLLFRLLQTTGNINVQFTRKYITPNTKATRVISPRASLHKFTIPFGDGWTYKICSALT